MDKEKVLIELEKLREIYDGAADDHAWWFVDKLDEVIEKIEKM